LLSGTETWHTAFKNTLEDLLIKFIEWSEKCVIQNLAGEATKTAATEAGVAARIGAEQTGAAGSLAVQGATLIRSILSSAAEAFAGVFGFLAPLMGPAAAGPARWRLRDRRRHGRRRRLRRHRHVERAAGYAHTCASERTDHARRRSRRSAIATRRGFAQRRAGRVVINPTTHFTVQASTPPA